MKNFIKTDGTRKTVSVSLEVFMIKEGDYMVAVCPALDLTTYGDDEKDARQAFEEALDIFLDDTHSKGTLEKVLLGLGWTLRKVPQVKYDPPKKSLFTIPNGKPKKIREKVLIPVD